MTQQKKARERKRQEKANRKREARAMRKRNQELNLETEEETGELQLLDGPNYFTDFDEADIRI